MSQRHPDRMGDRAYRWMVRWFRIADILFPKKLRLAEFGIREGDSVVDYGCGPGRYIEEASGRVGPRGKVYAVDIHELAIEGVATLVREKGLRNVTPILARGYSVSLPDRAADVIYALDMFHGIADPAAFLAEIRRIAKDSAIFILEDGHQSRRKAREKVVRSPHWRIEKEETKYLRCVPSGS